MKEKYHYNQKVKVIKGFWSGQKGEIINCKFTGFDFGIWKIGLIEYEINCGEYSIIVKEKELKKY